MTTLVALVDGGTAYLACDHQATMGWVIAPERKQKWFQLRDITIAITGTVRMGQILQNNLDRVSVPHRDDDQPPESYLWEYIVEPTRKLLKEYEHMETDEGKQSSPGSLMVLYQGRAYYMCSDFSLTRVTDFMSLGSGWNYALGSLDATTGLQAQERIALAMRAAARFDLYTSETFDVVESHRPLKEAKKEIAKL